MSKEKRSPNKEREGEDKNYIEISLPDFSSFKSKVEESIGDRISDSIAREVSIISEKGRVGLDPSLSQNGYGLLVCVAVIWIICLAAKAPFSAYALFGLLILPAVAFILLGKYEIRYESDGFSICMGKKELHRYLWTDVTDVRDGKRIYIHGKRLLVDSSAHGFDDFYHRARSACKGKGKPTPPSKKKSKNRKKNSR